MAINPVVADTCQSTFRVPVSGWWQECGSVTGRMDLAWTSDEARCGLQDIWRLGFDGVLLPRLAHALLEWRVAYSGLSDNPVSDVRLGRPFSFSCDREEGR